MCLVEQSRATACSSSRLYLLCSCVVCVVAFALALCTSMARMVLQLVCGEAWQGIPRCAMRQDFLWACVSSVRICIICRRVLCRHTRHTRSGEGGTALRRLYQHFRVHTQACSMASGCFTHLAALACLRVGVSCRPSELRVHLGR